MPSWTEAVRSRLAPLRLSPEREAEIVEELSQHLDQRYEDLLGAGAKEADARRVAIDELLDEDALASRMRPLRQSKSPQPITPGGVGWSAAGLWNDVRYAIRIARTQPGFAAVAILTLALGIGANSAIFAIVDAALLRPLAFPDPENLAMLWERNDHSDRVLVNPLDLVDWRQRSATFESFGAFRPSIGGMVMRFPDGSAETVSRQWVTEGLFRTLGVQPIVGRTFLPSDDDGSVRKVILSETLWRTRLGADEDIVGSEILLDGSPVTVVGVAPADFQLFGRASAWAMLPLTGLPPAARGFHAFQVVGRVKPGVSLARAEAELASIADALAAEHPKTNTGRGAALEPLRDSLIGSDLRLTSMLFLGVVGLALAICCANIANLLLARAVVRARELAIRSALGASRARLIRQLLAESLTLSVVGGAAGLALGAAILRAAPSLIPEGVLPPAVTLSFDLRIVAFCGAASLLVGLLFGLAPAWQATRSSTRQIIASDSRTVTGRGGRLREWLVGAEIATAVLLLIGAGLLLRTLLAIENLDRGYRVENVLTMTVDPLGSRYPTAEALLGFYDAVSQETQSIPGVSDHAWTTSVPLGPSYAGRSTYEIVGDTPVDQDLRPIADLEVVSPGYFRALGIALLAGRDFDSSDTGDKGRVAIVNEAFARRLEGRSALGLELTMRPNGAPDAEPVVREIVGVARQVKGRLDEAEPRVYVPLAQRPMGDIFLLVRATSGDAEALAPGVRQAIARIDRDRLVSVRGVMTLEDVAWEATARHRFRAILVMTFAGLALLLAMVGLFGVLAYSVQQRVRDFGLRRALGATSSDVFRLVAASAGRVVAIGAIVGLAAAAAFSRALASMLFAIEPWDPWTFAGVTTLLAATAILSIAAPAFRAVRVDPAVALRED